MAADPDGPNKGATGVVEDEHHGHHHHGTGVRWLDMILAGSAMLVSIISLFVSIEHGRTMERLVETNARQVRASTLPVLRFNHGNLADGTNKPTVHVDISNGGTGPAIIEWVAMSYAGHPIATVPAFLDACCRTRSSAKLDPYIINKVSGQTLSPGQSVSMLQLSRAGSDPDVYRRLEREGRYNIRLSACFCSVLDECSITDFRQTRPAPVAPCPAPPAGPW